MIIGRQRERDSLATLVASLEEGMSAAVVVRGEAGMGKTTLLDYVADQAASPLAVTRLAGLESEIHLGFGAIHRLLVPYQNRIGDLPRTQSEALRTALGLIDGPPANSFLLGLAVLTLFAEVTRDGPLVCIIDDAQWLDAESLQILAFVARRVYAERLGLFFGVREPTPSMLFEGIAAVELEGLPTIEATDLVLSLTRDPVDRQIAERIARRSGGNPLVITEACRELSAGRPQSGLLLDDPLPVGERLESHFRRRINVLPQDTQTLLLFASAIPGPDSDLLHRAALSDGLDPESAARPAVEAGLAELNPRFQFRHPLIRSSVYTRATDQSRRHVHSVIASLYDRHVDPDLRAWHLATAAAAPDESVAAELERSATSARNRGGFLAEAAYLARAAELSPDPRARAGRLLSAARAALSGGAPLRAQELLETVEPDLDDPALQAHAQKLRANASHRAGAPGHSNPAALLAAAQTFASTDGDLSREVMLEALEQTFVRAHLISGTTPHDVGAAAISMHSGSGDLVDLLLVSSGTYLCHGYVAAAPLMRAAVDALADPEALADEVPRWFALALFLAQLLWDEPAAKDWLIRCERLARRTGALDLLLMTLMPLSWVECRQGGLASADARVVDVRQVSRFAGIPEAVVSKMENSFLLACQGRDEMARVCAARAYDTATRIGSGNNQRLANIAILTAEIGRGHYDEAFALATQISAQDNVGMEIETLPTLIEAAVRSSHQVDAAAALERLRDKALASGSPLALGLLFRSEAMVAADERADALFLRALAQLEQTQAALDLARTHMLYGEWLRRVKRRSAAREQLRRAHEMFDEMGASAFAARAWAELKATGEHNTPIGNTLTAQEAQIARLAADGATNPEIATQLFISSHTVEYHLRKVFRKLGVSSRRKLHAALQE